MQTTAGLVPIVPYWMNTRDKIIWLLELGDFSDDFIITLCDDLSRGFIESCPASLKYLKTYCDLYKRNIFLVMKDYMKVFMNEGGDPYTILLELLTR
jgi:hypothetical protein